MRKRMMTLIEQIKELLKGIDKTDDIGGWWETPTGAKFGAEKLKKLLAIVENTPTPADVPV